MPDARPRPPADRNPFLHRLHSPPTEDLSHYAAYEYGFTCPSSIKRFTLPTDTNRVPIAVIGRYVGDDLAARHGQHKAAVIRESELIVLAGRGVAQRRPIVVGVVGRQPEAETELWRVDKSLLMPEFGAYFKC